MFARVKSKRRRSPRDHSGLGGLASYVLTPSPTKQSQVGIEPLPSPAVQQYQSGIEPFSPAKPTRAGADELFSRTTSSSMTTAESSSSTIQPGRIQKTGDKNSYWLSDHDDFYIDRKAAQKAYRVVSYKTTKTGKRKVFDILDGKVYHCGTGVQRRITDNAIVFSSRSEALSERFPSNQHEATKSGNGKYARMLVSFDVWGHCKARRGGVPSMVCEFARFMTIIEYLDAPSPMVTRLVYRNNVPFNFPGPDKTKPVRETVESEIKVYRMFNLKKRVGTV